MDLETRLHQLETQRMSLVGKRDAVIREAERMIARANAEFDDLALQLGREINELRARLHRQDAETERTERRRGRNTHKAPMLTGLDDDEQQHYLELLARRNKK